MTSVSVIIPAHDSERYLAAAIESVLAQTVPATEVIVVDDGSTDGTAEVAAAFAPRVACLSQENAGPAGACNRGLAAARGDLIAFLDADDLWVKEKLALQLRRLAREPRVEAVYGHAQEFLSPDVSEPAPSVHPGPAPFRARSTLLTRRESFDRVGPFDPHLRQADFIDWGARADDAGVRSVTLDDVLLHRRLHDSNLGRTDRGRRVEYVRAARAALHRRRGG